MNRNIPNLKKIHRTKACINHIDITEIKQEKNYRFFFVLVGNPQIRTNQRKIWHKGAAPLCQSSRFYAANDWDPSNQSPLCGEKPQNRQLSKFITGAAAAGNKPKNSYNACIYLLHCSIYFILLHIKPHYFVVQTVPKLSHVCLCTSFRTQ